jgi:hypothetical protein
MEKNGPSTRNLGAVPVLEPEQQGDLRIKQVGGIGNRSDQQRVLARLGPFPVDPPLHHQQLGLE